MLLRLVVGSTASSCCSRNCGSSLSHSGGGGGGGAALVGGDEEWESQQYSALIAATRCPLDSFDNTGYFFCHHAFFYDPRALEILTWCILDLSSYLIHVQSVAEKPSEAPSPFLGATEAFVMYDTRQAAESAIQAAPFKQAVAEEFPQDSQVRLPFCEVIE